MLLGVPEVSFTAGLNNVIPILYILYNLRIYRMGPLNYLNIFKCIILSHGEYDVMLLVVIVVHLMLGKAPSGEYISKHRAACPAEGSVVRI